MRTLLLFAAALAQAQTSQPAFEVASLRLTQHGRTPDGHSHSSIGTPSPGNLVAENESLQGLICYAYDVKPYQIAGPDWLDSDAASYDISAKTSPDTSHPEIRSMLQTLLAERVKLTVHHETRTLSGYVLVVGKNGHKLQPASSVGHGGVSSRGGQVEAHSSDMSQFVSLLSRWIGFPVFDNTGLKGPYDFNLDYAPNENRDGETRPSIFVALPEQLGLKLESSKVPVDMIVVDRAERVPTEN